MTIAYGLNNRIYKFLVNAAERAVAGLLLFLSGGETREMTAPLLSVSAGSRENINMQAERLFCEYGNSLLRLAYSYLHNMSDSEDVLQETLIRFIKTAPAFESDSHEKAWTMRVAINICKNMLVYNKTHYSDELSENLATDENEALSFVWTAVKELPDKYREVIHLYYHEGFQTAEIAKILGKNEATVRSLLYRGKLKLKEILGEAYDFEE
jgi:RNA polymerase sigma-70 factor (ECF subfamily)